MNNSNLAKLIQIISKIFIWIFSLILILNVIGIFYQCKRNAEFMELHPDGGSYLPVFIMFYFFIEIYVCVMLFWTWMVSDMKKQHWLRLLQLIIIFAIGILPSIYFAINVFLKK